MSSESFLSLFRLWTDRDRDDVISDVATLPTTGRGRVTDPEFDVDPDPELEKISDPDQTLD